MFGVVTQGITEEVLYAKMPLHLKMSKNQAYLGNGNSEQIVSHREKETELDNLETSDELQMDTVTEPATKSSPKD